MDSARNVRLPDLADLKDALESRLQMLMICLSHSWGGLEQVAASDTLEIAALGFKPRALVIGDSPVHRALKGKSGIEILPVDFTPRDILDFKLRSILHRQVREGTNLIHAHQPSLLPTIVPWIVRSPHVSLIATRHILSSHSKKSFIHRAIYGRVDALLVVSQTIRENVLATHAISPRKVKVVHLGLDFERFDPEKVDAKAQRERWGADPDTIIIGLVGRIDPAKGQATFLRAAAGLLKNPEDRKRFKLKFIIVGEETKGAESRHLDELKELVRQFRLEEFVVFTGYQENVPEVMQAFDIFVMPSRQEAFGLVAIEAMAMECPVIISQGGSAGEIIGKSNQSTGAGFGLLMRPDDAFDLQQKIRDLLEHPEECSKIGKKARAHVLAHYDRRERLQRTLAIYERALRRRRSH